MAEIYLDNSATTQTDPEVAALISEILTGCYGNPSSLHRKGFQAQLRLEQARETLADILDCRTDEVYFTGSGSEANNMAILGAAAAAARRKGSLVVSAAEHSSVLAPFRELEKQGWQVMVVAPRADGTPDTLAIADAVREDTLLVSAMLVNSETGSVCDGKALSKAVKGKNPKTLVHCDGVQGFCKLGFSPTAAGIDFFSFSGHKIHAPKGVAGLYVKKGVRLLPLYYGGGQERNLRPGTENVAFACGLALAAQKMRQQRRQLTETWTNLNGYFFENIKKIDRVCINSPENGAPYIMNISLLGLRSETVIHFLEDREIYISSGSACSKGAKSHVLTSMGLEDRRIDSALRISLGKYNTEQDIEALVQGLAQARQALASREG